MTIRHLPRLHPSKAHFNMMIFHVTIMLPSLENMEKKTYGKILENVGKYGKCQPPKPFHLFVPRRGSLDVGAASVLPVDRIDADTVLGLCGCRGLAALGRPGRAESWRCQGSGLGKGFRYLIQPKRGVFVAFEEHATSVKGLQSKIHFAIRG